MTVETYHSVMSRIPLGCFKKGPGTSAMSPSAVPPKLAIHPRDEPSNRSSDYHPDHRYTSILVQDSAYSFMVPHIAPEVEALHYNPTIVVDIDEVFED